MTAQLQQAPTTDKLVSPPRKTAVTAARILSVEEVASRISETKAMVKHYCNTKVFPNAFKGGTGGRTSPWRVPEKDVTNFLRAHGGI